MTAERHSDEMAAEHSNYESERSYYPLLKHERVWDFRKYTGVNVSMAIATWAFMQGGAVAMYVGAEAAIASIVIGYGISALLVSLAPCLPIARYGTEQYVTLRSVFGPVGSRIVMLLIAVFVLTAWTALLSIMFGRALTNVMSEIFGGDLTSADYIVTIFSLAAVVGAWFVLVKGARVVARFQSVIAPVLVVVTLAMLGLIFTQTSWAELTAVEPLAPMEDKHLAFMLAVELNVAGGFAWWPVFGNLARLTDKPRAAFWPNALGLFLASVVAAIVGAFAALTLGSDDPTVWMIPLGGAAFGVFALMFIALANVTSMVTQAFSGITAIISGSGSKLKNAPWALVTAAFMVPVGLIACLPGLVYDNYGRFLSWEATVVAPLCGIQLVDFFVLRRQGISLRDLYLPARTSRYGYWGGINVVAFVALAAGIATYTMLLHPVTYEPSALFSYIGASLPSAAVAATVHYLATRLLVQRLGLGGYDPSLPVTKAKSPVGQTENSS